MISVEKRVLIIRVKERASEAVWVSSPAYFFLEPSGIAIRPANSEEIVQIQGYLQGAEGVSFGFPVIVDSSNKPILIGQAALASERLAAISNTWQGLAAINLPVQKFVFEKPELNWLSVELAKGLRVLMNLDDDVSIQIKRLEALLLGGIEDIEYIDLRFGERVYYK